MKKIILTLTVIALAFGAILTPNVTAKAAFFGPDWDAVQAAATQIGLDAQTLSEQAAQMKANAQAIQAVENDPEVLDAAAQIITLATQIETDAANIAVTADDINRRIDHSEGTTLQLAADIGLMADRIGEMADRILWTELQIGVMADRIVTSEYLISDSSLTLAEGISNLSQSGVALTNNVLALTVQILDELG